MGEVVAIAVVDSYNPPAPSAKGDLMKFPLSAAEIGIYAISEAAPRICTQMQYQFDLNSLRDPIGHKTFKGLDGRDPLVRNWIDADKRVGMIVEECRRLAFDHIKLAKSRWLSFALLDHHGKWISAAVAEILAQALLADGYKVATVHDWLP